MQIDLIISRNIDGTTVIQCCMQHGNSIILCHIYFVQHTESTAFCATVNTSLSKFDLIILERIGTDQITTVCIYVKRYIVYRSVKNICQIFCQNIFSGCLRTCKEQILPLKQTCDRHFQNFFPIKRDGRLCDPACRFIRNRVHFPKFQYLFY